jgi:hypothetical protein
MVLQLHVPAAAGVVATRGTAPVEQVEEALERLGRLEVQEAGLGQLIQAVVERALHTQDCKAVTAAQE